MKRALLVVAASAFPSLAQAEVERFAVIAGSNAGAKDELTLKHAEDDAAKLASVLGELGGFLPENTLVLRGTDAAHLRRALITFNDRIRARSADPAVQPLLLVYFSGHADARAIHLGDSELELQELEQLVRGSAATYRILLLDACRSGALTRVKGGTSAPPFPIQLDERLDGEGVVFMTSSASGEDAQESEELGGSFFTHYFVSGLLGAADKNDDGRIGLREAYGYAYEQTLRASSRTLIGPQHPTFNYEVRGRDDLILTQPGSASKKRGTLEFREGRGYLVMQASSDGPVIAEVEPGDRVRRISVKPGAYFLRSRARDHLLEGSVSVAAGAVLWVDEAKLHRIEYARLVRKGRGPLAWTHGPQAGYRIETPISSGASFCQGAFAGYSFDFFALSVVPRLGFCRGGFTNDVLSATNDQFDLEARVAYPIDFRLVSLELGVGFGAALLHQSFDTLGRAPSRSTAAGELGIGATVEADIGAGYYLGADVEALTYLLKQDSADRIAGSGGLRPALTLRLSFGLGKRW